MFHIYVVRSPAVQICVFAYLATMGKAPFGIHVFVSRCFHMRLSMPQVVALRAFQRFGFTCACHKFEVWISNHFCTCMNLSLGLPQFASRIILSNDLQSLRVCVRQSHNGSTYYPIRQPSYTLALVKSGGGHRAGTQCFLHLESSVLGFFGGR